MAKNVGGKHPHYLDYKEPKPGGYYPCKLCTKWIPYPLVDENCPGMTKEDRKRIREREKQQKELSNE